MATRITMTTVPFNYQWPGRSAVTVVRDLGEVLLKDEIAVAAIAKGYAEPIDTGTASKARRKGKTPPAEPDTSPDDGNPSDTGQSDRVDREDLPPAHSADGGAPLADAG